MPNNVLVEIIENARVITLNGKVINQRHGGAYDRGSADSWYNRPPSPHFFEGKTYSSPRVDESDMTSRAIAEYHLGFTDQEATGNHKS